MSTFDRDTVHDDPEALRDATPTNTFATDADPAGDTGDDGVNATDADAEVETSAAAEDDRLLDDGPVTAGPDADVPGAEPEPDVDPVVVPVAGDPDPSPEVPEPAADRGLVEDPDSVRQRWQTVQVGFVDDPRQAVSDAGQLVDEVVDLVVTGIGAQRDQLGESWSADDLDTEQLRIALRGYRELLDRLLAV